MYNRYIPQPDGTYRRNRIQETVRPPERPVDRPTPAPTPQLPISAEPEPSPCKGCIHHAPPRRPPPKREYCRKEPAGISSFLKQLLPKDFGTEDLLVVLLLLLMAGDCQENQNTALLTLVLYLFL